MGKTWKTTMDGRRTETATWTEGQRERYRRKLGILRREISSTHESKKYV
jgi:hypothetical protein